MRDFYLVAVYLEDLRYGGPEEGGWYYNVGQLVRIVKGFSNRPSAYAYCRRLNDKLKSRDFGPNQDRREMSSVLSAGEYWAHVYSNEAPKYFPDRKPRYE